MMPAKIRILLLLGVCLATAEGWLWSNSFQTVCYERWGCFSLRAPFLNTVHLPEPPEELGLRFFLHTRDHASRARTLLDLDWSSQRLGEEVDVSKDTRMILHGYLDDGDQPWVWDMAEALLERADQNVIVVDWGRGARSMNYLQVAANTRLVGKMVAAFLTKLVEMGAPPSSFHLIGVSLGAHIAGYVGSHLDGIGRITGLDPAGPSFENTSPQVRLDPYDALFVDVIHTNAVPIYQMGLGFIDPCGTVDFYPNRGRYQPGCHNSLLSQFLGILRGQDAMDAMGCSHLRSVDYFIDSITSECAMTATPCSFPQLLNQYYPCRHSSFEHRRHCEDCVTMGYDVNLTASGVFYVRTRSDPPYCVDGV